MAASLPVRQSARNRASYGDAVAIPEALPGLWGDILADPQTSGGLLLAVSGEQADGILAGLHAVVYAAAAVIGSVGAGAGRVEFT